MRKKDFSVYIDRRNQLIKNVKQEFSSKKGIILLFANFEIEKYKFRQESTFYYFTGLEEPGVVLLIDFDKNQTFIYVPRYTESRQFWASSILFNVTEEIVHSWGITDIQYLGDACKGYSISSKCNKIEYTYFIDVLKEHVKKGHSIFTTYSWHYFEQSLFIDRLIQIFPELKSNLIDISPIIADMRRTKSKLEIESIYNAVDCTMNAQEAAAQLIKPGKMEYEIQAAIEFIFKQSNGSAAFPSIVGSGINSTVLHYTANDSKMAKGDLVVIDIGAEIDYYCADLTRTYPVSGTFTKRQREVYNIVLETQEYIENIAKPGYWLNNKDKPKQSLNHLAFEFLKKKGYNQYFPHSIGHFLGMDVHDVGDYSKPLEEGDVITIEPGIYIQDEKIGIRIEDNYWIVKDGLICLSQDLPKDPKTIEEMMKTKLD